MEFIIALLAVLGGLAIGAGAGYYGRSLVSKKRIGQAEFASTRIVEDAKEQSRAILIEAKEESLELRREGESEIREQRSEMKRSERRLANREENLEHRGSNLEKRERSLTESEREAEELQSDLESLKDQALVKIEEVAEMTIGEASEVVMRQAEDDMEHDIARRYRDFEQEATERAQEQGARILATSIHRMAAEVVSEITVTTVPLPSDDMKGRLIGREGRNIRAIEKNTGVDLIIDDTPEAVVLSGFNPVRREVARIALGRLIEDGRIHPGRIEEVVEKSLQEVEESMAQAAEEVLYELGIHNVHREIVKTLGRLKFRTSYGQNQLQHAKEVAQLAGSMAAEMGLDVQAAKRAGVLHDVGKGLTHEHEGTHVELGYRLCKKHEESAIVLNAIKAHHDEEPHYFAETFLVSAADAISGSRPGARREMVEGYVKRLEKLEELAMEHPGVERCFAIQAGRELRVMVEPSRVTDGDMAQISEAVARKIENELQYPGQIKVVVVRETRAIDFAR